MKRTLALWIAAAMLSVLLCGTLTACGGGKPEDSEGPHFGESMHEPETPSQMEYSWEREWNERRDDIPAWYYEKKAVLADMTAEEVCEYTMPLILSCGTFTDANTISNQEMLMLLAYKNYPAWELNPNLWIEEGGVRMTYDEVVEELQRYLDFDPEKVNLKKSFGYDPETETFLFTCDFGGDRPYIILDDKWEEDRRIITIGDDPNYILPADNIGKYNEIVTLEQNGEYIRYVSRERVPNKKWKGN